MLAVSELVTNAFLHGRLRAEQRIKVAVLASGGRMRVRVSHVGKTFAPLRAAASPAGGGGRGLLIVKAVTHAWGVEHDDRRTIVWFEV